MQTPEDLRFGESIPLYDTLLARGSESERSRPTVCAHFA